MTKSYYFVILFWKTTVFSHCVPTDSPKSKSHGVNLKVLIFCLQRLCVKLLLTVLFLV